MITPRNPTLAEALYYGLRKNEYLNEIYQNLLYNYSIRLLHKDEPLKEIKISDALRFADLLSKSTHTPTAAIDRQWGQEIAILLRLVYPEEKAVQYYLGSVLSAVGNYRGLKSKVLEGYQNEDVLDRIYYEFDKDLHKIPGKEDEYFFHDQKRVFDGLKGKFFSYSGPTSMGKSFVVQTYIRQQIEAEDSPKHNYAILVPTKALINEVRSSLIGSLQKKLKELNYRVVTAAGDIVLKQDHHFIFVMTPERLLHMMIEKKNIQIHFLFIDEAHKISDRGGRSTYYYKVITQLANMQELPTIVFASPNIPNPEIYLNLIPGIQDKKMEKLASKFTPVCQFKYFVDYWKREAYTFNDYTRKEEFFCKIPPTDDLPDLVKRVGREKQNVIYCSSRKKVVDYAVKYAKDLPVINDDKLKTLANDIRAEVHKHCFLADLILRGVAYHVGYLPANIRLRIEKSFEEGLLRTIFCTSTLVEGVNLPADNLFITSYRDGISNMDEVEFRNLIGRVGRIRFNLYGNAFLVRLDDSLKAEKFIDLLKKDVPEQSLSLDIKKNKQHFNTLINDLVAGDVKMTQCHTASSEEDFEALRKFGLILTRDLATGAETPIKKAFEPYLDDVKIQAIQQNFPVEQTSDDITISYDQYESLKDLIADEEVGHYPELKGEDDEVDFEDVVDFLITLRKVFKWDIYEKETLGKPISMTGPRKGGILRWYATILLRWMRGNGLSTIIHYAMAYKEKYPDTGVWLGKVKYADRYEKDNAYHQNYVIAETLGVIENVLLFSICNYFRKFSIEYKAQHDVENFDNDWYEFVEYGTTNPDTIFLQQSGFSREASIYIQEPRNKEKYIIEVDGEKKIHRSILTCGNLGVETEAQDIQFNVPELFVD